MRPLTRTPRRFRVATLAVALALVGTACSTEPTGHEAARAERAVRVTFVLRNEGVAPIYLQLSDGCPPEAPAWLEVSLDGEPLALAPSCALCACGASDEPCQAECAACGDPSAEVLAHGKSASYGWDGQRYVTHGDPSCQQLEPAPAAALDATMCWGLDVWPSGQVTEPQCASQSFAIGDGDEVHVAAGG
jgi:hypothetical protein